MRRISIANVILRTNESIKQLNANVKTCSFFLLNSNKNSIIHLRRIHRFSNELG